MDQVKRAYYVLVAATVILYLFVSTFSIYAFISNRHRSTEGQQAKSALCVLKQDLIRRQKITKEFLKDNPNGSGGITKGVILNSIKNQESTIKALKNLHC